MIGRIVASSEARVQNAVRQATLAARLARDLPAFLRTPVTADRAAEAMREQIRSRARRFLLLADRAIYRHPRSPYLKLLRAAGCDFGDLRALVQSEGLEGALRRLAGAGVYVTFDELKGRAPAIRGSQRFTFGEQDFDNPRFMPHFDTFTGGTRGAPSRVGRSLGLSAAQAVDLALLLDAHGVRDPEHVFWSAAPIVYMLLAAKLGHPLRAWFNPLAPLPPRVRVGARYLAILARLGGSAFPTPRYVDLRDPSPLVAWLARRGRTGRPICVATTASGAVRIALAAAERGLDLQGVCFLAHGEPMTPARARAIADTGARAIVYYGLAEAAFVGASCATGAAPDDLHVWVDRFAVIRRERPVAGSNVRVDALLLTSLHRFAPKILLNTESGDFGELERRPCGCRLGETGLNEHLSAIRSFEKLTGEGMTFAKSSLVQVLEEVLPARFGGESADYQLLEREADDGFARLCLLVSPRIGSIDETGLRQTFLAELARDGELAAYMAGIWRQAGTLEIARREPVATPAGKVFPFHVVKGGGGGI